MLTWSGPCPDEHLEPFCDMHTRMSTDVPVGDIDAQPVAVDAERLRAREQRLFRSYDGITSVARRRADGVFGGYSQLYLPHGADYVYQDDTLVMPEHRGHRLGTLLKLATLEVLQRERPGAGRASTPTPRSTTTPCRRPTATSGSAPVERMYEMQRRDG